MSVCKNLSAKQVTTFSLVRCGSVYSSGSVSLVWLMSELKVLEVKLHK